MTNPEVMNLTTVSMSFPELPESQIHRENLLDTIETMLNGGTGIVVVEGEEGVGKTTLLAQFALGLIIPCRYSSDLRAGRTTERPFALICAIK